MDHIQVKQKNPHCLGSHCHEAGKQQMFKCPQRHCKHCYRKNSPEKVRASGQVQAALTLKFRLIHICISVNDLIDHKKKQDHTFSRCIIPDPFTESNGPCSEKQRTCNQCKHTGYISMFSVFLKGILSLSVCDLERPDAKIGH